MRSLSSLVIFSLLLLSAVAIHAQEESLPLQKSAVDNSFKETAAYLDAGGELFVYLSTERAIAEAKKQFDKLAAQSGNTHPMRMVAVISGGMKPFLQRLGVFDMSGLGISSIRTTDQLSRNRMMIYGAGAEGAMWKLLGTPGQGLAATATLPAYVDIAFASRLDGQLLADTLVAAAADAMPQAADQIQHSKAMLKQHMGIDIDQLLRDFGNELALAVAFDQETMVEANVQGVTVKLPKPDFILMVQTNGTYIYDLLAGKIWNQKFQAQARPLGDTQMLVASEELNAGELAIRPALAQVGSLMLIGSSPETLEKHLAAESRLIDSDAFKSYGANLPDGANQLVYIGPRVADMVTRLQAQVPVLETMSLNVPIGLGVTTVEKDGILFTSNSPAGPSFLAVQAAALPLTVFAPAILPKLFQVRRQARHKASISNLRQVGLGCILYADDHDGRFPTQVGYLGLNMLVEQKYLQDGKVFIHPNDVARQHGNGLLPRESATSYAYVGAGLKISNTTLPTTPIALLKPALDEGGTLVLFMDGHVERRPDRADTVASTIEALHQHFKWPDADYQLLLENARQIDAAEAQ